jgi:hypothetical protein
MGMLFLGLIVACLFGGSRPDRASGESGITSRIIHQTTPEPGRGASFSATDLS